MKRNLLELCGKAGPYSIYKLPRSMQPGNQRKRYFASSCEFSNYFYDSLTRDVNTIDECIDYLQKEIIDRYGSIDRFFYTQTEAYYYLNFIIANEQAQKLRYAYENIMKEISGTEDTWDVIDNAPIEIE